MFFSSRCSTSIRVHERIVHFIEVATTHWLGGQHGEEGKRQEEDREEGEAESEALERRLGVFDAVSKASSIDPAASSGRDAIARDARRIGSKTEGVGEPEVRTSRSDRLSGRAGTGGWRNPAPRHRRMIRRWVRTSDISPTPSAFLSIIRMRTRSCRRPQRTSPRPRNLNHEPGPIGRPRSSVGASGVLRPSSSHSTAALA